MSVSLKQHNIKNISVQYAYVELAKIKKKRIQTIFAGAHLGGGECSSHCRDQAAAGEDKLGNFAPNTGCLSYRQPVSCGDLNLQKDNLVFNRRVRSSRKWQCKSAEVASSSTRCLYCNIRLSFKPIFMTSIVTILIS